jgi:hypothetical protein
MMSRAYSQTMFVAFAALATALGTQPAFPSYTSGIVTTRNQRMRRHVWPRYPFSSARQDGRRYITVTGRNGHATMQRVK